MKKIIMFSILILVCILYIGSYFLISFLYQDLQDRGQFGDMFGAVNALFSGLALFGIIITLFMQKEELELQREELRNNREELKRTADSSELNNQLNILSSLVEAYAYILNPSNGLKNREIEGYSMNETIIKGKLVKTLMEIDIIRSKYEQ